MVLGMEWRSDNFLFYRRTIIQWCQLNGLLEVGKLIFDFDALFAHWSLVSLRSRDLLLNRIGVRSVALFGLWAVRPGLCNLTAVIPTVNTASDLLNFVFVFSLNVLEADDTVTVAQVPVVCAFFLSLSIFSKGSIMMEACSVSWRTDWQATATLFNLL